MPALSLDHSAHAADAISGNHIDDETAESHRGPNSILQQVLTVLDSLDSRMKNVEESLAAVSQTVSHRQSEKEWYTTNELAALLGKSDFTVREKWCNQGRIECEKDPDSGKWRIPAHEVRRLQNGGALLPRQPRQSD